MTPCSLYPAITHSGQETNVTLPIYCADFHVHALCLWYLWNPKLDIKTLTASCMCLHGIAKKELDMTI